LERRLDAVEDGSRKYEPTVREWYTPFSETVTRAESNMERVKIFARETGEECPECHEGKLVVREGRFGEFVGCARYPECKYIQGKDRTAAEPTGEACPDCTKPLVVRTGRRGPFIGCSGYPACKYIKGDLPAVGADGMPLPVEDLGTCPECAKPLARRGSKRGPFIGCTGYPACRYIQPRGAAPAEGGNGVAAAQGAGPAPEPTGEVCPDCGNPLVKRQGRYGPFVSCSAYPKCKFRPPKVAAVAASGSV
jgi:DNA topoisomerase-1